MRSRVALLVCLGAVGVTLQGCGSDDNKPGGGGGGGGDTTTVATTTTQAPETTTTVPQGPTTTSTTGATNPFCTDASGTIPPVPAVGQPIGWPPTTGTVGGGQWCSVGIPPGQWKLTDYCGDSAAKEEPTSELRFLSATNDDAPVKRAAADAIRVKVLTYNLYWWNLFGQRKGADGMAGKNIAANAKDETFDLMGFQECENVSWPMSDAKAAGMSGNFNTIVGDYATALAYNSDVFSELGHGKADVGEDGSAQHYGRRGAHWVRLKHKASGKTVFFINHHGPTPVNSGGLCGADGTAFNILKVIATNALVGDRIILVGDFNAWSNGPDGAWLQEIGKIDCHLPHRFSNPVLDDVWGIDNMFGACVKTVETKVMDKGGSDHNALYGVFEI